MEAGVNTSEKERVMAWILLESPPTATAAALCSSSELPSASFSFRIPKRLRNRLLLESRTPTTVDEIEAKLRDAHLRRQKYYEKLASKARSKTRSPSHSSLEEEDLGQRLEAKLQAAERKRLSILASAQKRLARLDELRKAAKTGIELQYEEERLKLGNKVQSRVQRAEENRLLILKAYSQRRATLKERASMSVHRRISRDKKYKECVRAAIRQKRVAAETKRLGLVEAEKKKAFARALQVRQVANSVYRKRELEVRIRKERLEDRLLRARRQRAEYLKQRGRQSNPIRMNVMSKQAELLSQKLARCWRRFIRMRRTTLALTEAYDILKINEKAVKSMPFDQLAVLIESSATLQTVKALLDRLEYRFKVSRDTASLSHQSSLVNIDHLLKRVASPKRKTTPKTSARTRGIKKVGSTKEAINRGAKLSRYSARVILCAYMILVHPDAVFSEQGEHEKELTESAKDFVREFELLLKIILEGPIQRSDGESDSSSPKRCTFRSQLATFDNAWCSYLNCFVVWKVKDARLLEDDLVRAACQLEISMIQTCKLTPDGDSIPLTHDMKAIQKQVMTDQKLIREKVQHLNGDAGIERMERALFETRSKYFTTMENGSPTAGTPTMHFLPSPSVGHLVSSSDNVNNEVIVEKPGHVRSLFREDDAMRSEPDLSNHKSYSDHQLVSGPELITENELLVNEFLHEQHQLFSDSLSATAKHKDYIKMTIRETMEKAFWDGIKESIIQDEPNYDRVLQLMEEVRDELCKVAPESWTKEITETINVDLLFQVLKSRNLDFFYLGRTLEFSLVTLQKLSSPCKDSEKRAYHQRFLKELAELCQAGDDTKNSCVIPLIKGLRFVLEQIQVLKQEISEARINLVKPILEGPDGVDYLRNAFTNRFGSVSGGWNSLPLTVHWLSSVSSSINEEWEEHKNAVLTFGTYDTSSQGCLPSNALRTGGVIAATVSAPKDSKGYELPECNGGKVDLLVRLGLLKLVTRVSGLTQEELPETLRLNLSRLRAIQTEIQKVIVITISILVYRQTIASEGLTTSSLETESIVATCVERLSNMLDQVQDAGIEEITEVISKLNSKDGKRLQTRRLIMGRMIGKCLQPGDAVFEKVKRAVYLALRGVVLGGSGPNGKRLAESALRLVGAGALAETVVKAGRGLVSAAIVSVAVHGPWYSVLAENMMEV